MAARDQTATVQLKIRMREALRARLEQAAEARQVSLNAEAVERLQGSFGQEDAWGGPGVKQMAMLMASTFVLSGEMAARGTADPPEDWKKDAYCYQQAMVGVLDALLKYHPDHSVERMNDLYYAIKSRFAGTLLNEQEDASDV